MPVAVGRIGGLRRWLALASLAALGLGCSSGDPGSADGVDGAVTDGTGARTAEQAGPDAAADDFDWPAGPHPVARIEVEGLGAIELELYPELAPVTVANFEKLAADGFYEGTTFHRVVPGFMIQGGDPNSKDANPRNDGAGGPGYTIPDEPNGAPHVDGVLSMANTGRPDSGGSQFFIVLGRQAHLDGRHTVFGRVRSGRDVVEAISRVETDAHGRFGPKFRPLEPIAIERVEIEAPSVAQTDG